MAAYRVILLCRRADCNADRMDTAPVCMEHWTDVPEAARDRYAAARAAYLDATAAVLASLQDVP